jgi:hypothetical protein
VGIIEYLRKRAAGEGATSAVLLGVSTLPFLAAHDQAVA